MNQDSTINKITTAQNITQAILTQTFYQNLKKTQKTNSIMKMNVILSAKNLQNRTTKWKC